MGRAKLACISWQISLQIRVFQTPYIYVFHNNTEGLKAPGYSLSRLPDVFHSSLQIHVFKTFFVHRYTFLVHRSLSRHPDHTLFKKDKRCFRWAKANNLFNVVQFAHARHSSSKLVSALAQSQISGSHRGKGVSKGSQWDAETSSAWPFTLDYYYRRNTISSHVL